MLLATALLISCKRFSMSVSILFRCVVNGDRGSDIVDRGMVRSLAPLSGGILPKAVAIRFAALVPHPLDGANLTRRAAENPQRAAEILGSWSVPREAGVDKPPPHPD